MKPQTKTETIKSAPRPDDGKSREAALRAVEIALEKKGLEPVVLDVRELASYTDYIVVVSGRSDRQVAAIAEAIALDAKEHGRRAIGTEGSKNGQWTLLDFGDVIVHVFYHPVRDYYDLESLWIDAERLELEIPPEARARPDELYQ